MFESVRKARAAVHSWSNRESFIKSHVAIVTVVKKGVCVVLSVPASPIAALEAEMTTSGVGKEEACGLWHSDTATDRVMRISCQGVGKI